MQIKCNFCQRWVMLPHVQPHSTRLFVCECSQQIQVTVKSPGVIFVRQWIDDVLRRTIPENQKPIEPALSLAELEYLLKTYERSEQYEQCARIRDQIKSIQHGKD